MGNMTALIVVCSVCGLLILILLFAYKKISKKNSSSKLEEEINKYKRMNEGTYVEGQSKAVVKNKKQLKKKKNSKKLPQKRKNFNKKSQILSALIVWKTQKKSEKMLKKGLIDIRIEKNLAKDIIRLKKRKKLLQQKNAMTTILTTF